MLKELLLLAVAGSIGTLGRYGVTGLVQNIAGPKLPWGTLVVNVVGCFLFALIWELAEERLLISGQTRFIVLTGFMGAFTTFSTFGFETGALLRDSQWLFAAANVLANNVAGLAAIFLGFAVGRWI